ncbi:hypothetical protein ACKVEX_01245 [Rhodocyclaceae bacterium SMB388]
MTRIMKHLSLKSLDRTERLQVLNHAFFITAFLFVAHQNVLTPQQVNAEVPMIAQALQMQPHTPPPGYDPDQMSSEELDLRDLPDLRELRDMSVRPE